MSFGVAADSISIAGEIDLVLVGDVARCFDALLRSSGFVERFSGSGISSVTTSIISSASKKK